MEQRKVEKSADETPPRAAPTPEPSAGPPIGFDDVTHAAERLRGVAHRTLVLSSRTLERELGAQVSLKAECFQRVGAFKFRGAYNHIAALDPAVRARGVCAVSSGNHAQAVALAARLHAAPATVVMPDDAPTAKLDATRGYGAEVVTYDRYAEDRMELGRSVASERGLALVPPYDDPLVMAGQGTAALELIEEVGEIDVLVVPVGGGGLISGCATAARGLVPAVRVIGVEPDARDVARRSLATGQRVRGPVPRTIADGQQTEALGELTFSVMRAAVEDVVGVTDAELVAGMRWLLERQKVLAEPSGASALAAVLSGKIDVRGLRVGVVVSGGNVGADRLAALLADGP